MDIKKVTIADLKNMHPRVLHRAIEVLEDRGDYRTAAMIKNLVANNFEYCVGRFYG
jgi:hypothetical protein